MQSVTSPYTSAYTYDLNGNAKTATGGKWRSISYNTFNLPDSELGIQAASGAKARWLYDENHQRVKDIRVDSSGGTRSTWYMHPDNQGGLGFKRETAANGASSNRHYISAGGSAFAVIVTARS